MFNQFLKLWVFLNFVVCYYENAVCIVSLKTNLIYKSNHNDFFEGSFEVTLMFELKSITFDALNIQSPAPLQKKPPLAIVTTLHKNSFKPPIDFSAAVVILKQATFVV